MKARAVVVWEGRVEEEGLWRVRLPGKDVRRVGDEVRSGVES